MSKPKGTTELNHKVVHVLSLCEEFAATKDDDYELRLAKIGEAKSILFTQIPEDREFSAFASERNAYYQSFEALKAFIRQKEGEILEQRFYKLRLKDGRMKNGLSKDITSATSEPKQLHTEPSQQPINNHTPPSTKPLSPPHEGCYELSPSILSNKIRVSKTLVIDVRPHSAFEVSHVPSKLITCLEPTSLRSGMSVLDLEDTLVIAPQSEAESFSYRREVDLIVMYDEHSTKASDNVALTIIEQALQDAGLHPYVLRGGFAAWQHQFSTKKQLDRPSRSSSLPAVEPLGMPAPLKPQPSPDRFALDRFSPHRLSPPKQMSPAKQRSPPDPPPFQESPHQSTPPPPPTHAPPPVIPPKEPKIQRIRTPESPAPIVRREIPIIGPPSHTLFSIESPTHKPPPIPSPASSPASAPTYPPPTPLIVNGLQTAPTSTYSGGYADVPAKMTLPSLRVPKLRPTALPSSPLRPVSSPQRYDIIPYVEETPPRHLLSMTGLRNLGNTCYMNCVLQCLLSIIGLVEPFQNGMYREYINPNSRLGQRGQFAHVFAAFVTAMLQPSPHRRVVEALSIKHFSAELRPDSFGGFEQQDCQEFLTFVLDTLHEDLNSNGDKQKSGELGFKEEARREQLGVRVASAIEWERYLRGDTSLIVDLFQGQYLSRLQCMTCKHTSTTYNSFSSLSLPIVAPKLLGQYSSLKACFDEFVKPEILDGDNAWVCPNCKVKRRTMKTLQISRLPPVLVIHLKRFKRSAMAGVNKLETPVEYPLRNLDLTKYWPQLNQGDQNEKEAELLAQIPKRGQQPPFIYDLRAVTLHRGTLKGGHYTAVVQKPGVGWFYFDDSQITPVKEQAAVSKHAYVLIYKRRM